MSWPCELGGPSYEACRNCENVHNCKEVTNEMRAAWGIEGYLGQTEADVAIPAILALNQRWQAEDQTV
jgi:hypothetical protein